jgi:L-ascorbate metabolism protein UlaG (beta-lactamase superfamily)
MADNNSIQLVRNATLLLNYAGKRILVDPMFFPKGAFDPIAGKKRNPMVELPMPLEKLSRTLICYSSLIPILIILIR